MWALSPKYPFQPPLVAGAGGFFAPLIRALHPEVGRPRRRRHPRGREGPQERAEEPVRAPAHGRHLARVGEGLADALGPDPLPRDVSLLGRRLRDGARRTRTGGEAGAARRRRGCAAPRCAASRAMFAGRNQVHPARRARLRRRRLPAGGHHAIPRREIDVAELYVPSAGSSRCGSRTSGSPGRTRAGD